MKANSCAETYQRGGAMGWRQTGSYGKQERHEANIRLLSLQLRYPFPSLSVPTEVTRSSYFLFQGSHVFHHVPPWLIRLRASWIGDSVLHLGHLLPDTHTLISACLSHQLHSAGTEVVPTGVWEAVPQSSDYHSFLRQCTARCNRGGKQRGRGMRDRQRWKREGSRVKETEKLQTGYWERIFRNKIS